MQNFILREIRDDLIDLLSLRFASEYNIIEKIEKKAAAILSKINLAPSLTAQVLLFV
jgi:hypothetical protein